MASEMMKNMKPEDMQNMMRTFQENPQMMDQARRMMGGNHAGGPASYPSPPHSEHSPLEPINTLKKAGNDFIQHKEYEKAGVKYLEAILDIESLRGQLTPAQTASQKFLSDLSDLEVGCRNNYCIAKTNLGEFGLILPHAERILAIDAKNPKALYNVSLAHFNLREYNKANDAMDKLVRILGPNSLGSKIEELRTKINEKLTPPELKVEPVVPQEGGKSESQSGTPTPTKQSSEVPTTEKKEEKQPAVAPEEPVEKQTPPKADPQPPKNVFDVPPTHSPATPNRPPVHEDFRFDDEDQSEKLEAIFQKHKKNPQQFKKDVPNAAAQTEPTPQPFQSESPSSQTPSTGVQGFLNRYWQILLGVLIGLIISKLLR